MGFADSFKQQIRSELLDQLRGAADLIGGKTHFDTGSGFPGDNHEVALTIMFITVQRPDLEFATSIEA